jgi:hypothetical protein
VAITIPSRQETGIHTLASGLSMEWKEQGRIFAFTWRNINRETVDTYAQVYRAITEQWPIKEPLLHFNDINFPGFSFTPYLRHQVQLSIKEALKLGIHGRVANVMADGISTRLVQLFLRATAMGPGVQSQVFFHSDKAYAWLVKALQ